MTKRTSKERTVSTEEIKAVADRAEARSAGLPVEDKVEPASALNPPAVHAGGRPSKYKPEFAHQAKVLCELGATDAQLADHFQVTIQTIHNWTAQHKEFFDSRKAMKDHADSCVERSLYQKACGYSYDAVKIFSVNGEPLVVPYREHVPPDTTAGIFWLKNRKPQEWRDRREMEIGKPGDFASLSHEELVASLKQDIVEFGADLLKAIPDTSTKNKGKEIRARVKGNGTQH